MSFKKNKQVLVTSLFLVMALTSCSHNRPWSSRDITPEEKHTMEVYPQISQREPADWVDRCTTGIRNFFNPKNAPTDNISPKALPELTQLQSKVKKFPNGKSYTEYQASLSALKHYADYDEYVAETAEIIFEPVEPFGHINLRVGKTVYSFNFIQSTSINNYSPRLKVSENPEMSDTTGFVFHLGSAQIEEVEAEIKAFYKSSASHNIPPFDAYGPLLKIHEKDAAFGKKLFFDSDSPKFGNKNPINGKIIEEDGKYFLDADNGIKVPVLKKNGDYFTQSYTCASSAAHILKKFFGIDLSYNVGAKSIKQSLENGNMNESISPIGIMKYEK